MHLQPKPLPKTWLESVTRAILSPSLTTRPALRQACLSLSQAHHHPWHKAGGIYHTWTVDPAAHLASPALCVRVQSHLGCKAVSEITRTRVMCRSAPSSRPASRERGGTQDRGR